MQAPRSDFTRANCADDRCYPGLTGCKHHWALTGSCNPGAPETGCPIYFLYNWRWIKSHLWEVGAVTSSITVYQSLFRYGGGVYSGYWKLDGKTQNSGWENILGMLDVTIIGWGQTKLNLSLNSDENTQTLNRWWWVIPHFGVNFGVAYDACNEQTTTTTGTKNNKGDCRKTYENILDNKNGQIKIEPLKVVGSGNGEQSSTIKGFMKFNRRFDDCNIESHAVGAVPYNFVPLPHRTPEPTENPED
ncbi:hypothetical protein TVAG_304330 [Trichomonas vaginalis G3]|uniref:Uncharacterized protein n=1 Tax=Trichomonas vaginalis (strain ATCC PRA-98 / G3) TaxID=412133 RepID=A2FGR7_TRIV3|nr:cysteine proteinases family [Trichomonas vaginalis G3]EAX95903.1 hypothetical protein TVAG_304330 [Trichomonas vaginalis G3]KAI5551227.1 cysteine proteinases family [Trichomonas vaginalis G3]|eukprot:XP_001308833.1 hypothetical protein [Trichomonas vaginalis G3]